MEKQLTKEQWLDLFEKNEFVEYLEEKLTFYESSKIISSKEMTNIIEDIDFEEEHSDWNCGSYSIDEAILLHNDFEKDKYFLMSVAELFD